MTPEHTFVIPVYGESPYLEVCVQSLLAQLKTGAILMATSTPTQYSQNIADKYNIPYRVNPKNNAGIAGDWNFALSVAQTPWVTIAHQDDIYHPGYRQQVLAAVQNKNHTLIAFTDYTDLVGHAYRSQSVNAFVKRSLLLPFKLSKAISNKALKKLMLMPGCPICCPSVTFNMSLLKDFEFDTGYRCVLDWDAWLHLANRPGAFVYVDKPLIVHRIHAQSETVANIDNGKRLAEEKRLLEKLWGRWLAGPISRLYASGHRDNLG